MNAAGPVVVAHIPDDPGFAPRFDDLRAACSSGTPHAAFEKLRLLHADADRFIEGLKRGLFHAPLALNDAQKVASRWILLQHDQLSRHAGRVAEALARDPGADPGELAHAVALGLHHTAEAMKCEMSEGAREPRHFPRLHALMRRALEGGWEQREVALQVQGVPSRCTIESLYFRALLLARTGGILSIQQVEILDAWFWMWMPALHGTRQRPDGPWLRVSLDSNRGLRRDPRIDGGMGLYLPLVPLESAYRSVLREFQNGKIVPAEGHASRFRLEEHMVVLDLARRSLRGIRSPVARAPRSASSVTTQLHVGITEILSHAFNAPPPADVPVELVALEGKEDTAPRRERDNPIEDVYEIARRHVKVIDVSASGLGLEGEFADCGEISVGDIVALRLSADGPIELGKVARRARACDEGRVTIGVHRAPAPDNGRVAIGVRQLSTGVQRLRVTPSSANPARRVEQMLFVPGKDSSGRHDAFLLADYAPVLGYAFEAEVGGQTFSLQLNRVRDRGRGWVLAGFEIHGMGTRDPLEAAA